MEHVDFLCKNENQSSKTMKASTILKMILELCYLGIRVEFIVFDDDSTMCADLYHIGIIINSKLSLDVHQLLFLCNPFYCVKVMVKNNFGSASMIKEESKYPSMRR